jgi:exosortase A-associated hydrolase 2
MNARPGRRFCLLYEPVEAPCRGCVLYVHPFAEEMNKSRRMAAQQARAFARLGYRVLLIDLYGCGDSDGDFVDARWEIWLEDLRHASDWLRPALNHGLSLWGLRLGATLAVAYAEQSELRPASLHLWQPVVNGELFMTQFLRVKVASEMLTGERMIGGTQALRAQLTSGLPVEIGGYELAPELWHAIEAIRIAEYRLPSGSVPVHWYEVVSETAAGVAPAAARVVDALRGRSIEVDLRVAVGEPFWATTEITECPHLLEQTASALQSYQ